jgi:hypothetical protein
MQGVADGVLPAVAAVGVDAVPSAGEVSVGDLGQAHWVLPGLAAGARAHVVTLEVSDPEAWNVHTLDAEVVGRGWEGGVTTFELGAWSRLVVTRRDAEGDAGVLAWSVQPAERGPVEPDVTGCACSNTGNSPWGAVWLFLLWCVWRRSRPVGAVATA